MAVLCTVATYGGCIVLVLLPIRVLLASVIVAFVCMLIFLFYTALGDNSKKDDRWKDW